MNPRHLGLTKLLCYRMAARHWSHGSASDSHSRHALGGAGLHAPPEASGPVDLDLVSIGSDGIWGMGEAPEEEGKPPGFTGEQGSWGKRLGNLKESSGVCVCGSFCGCPCFGGCKGKPKGISGDRSDP